MKRIVLILIAGVVVLPLSTAVARRSKVYPMMMGPKLSTTVIPTEEILSPFIVSADMLINLYKNYFWLRTDVASLSIKENSNDFGINLGSPFDFVLMWHNREWRPYAFGGFGISVKTTGENSITMAGVDAGGGLSYEVSTGLHLFGEAGVDLDYTNPSPNGAVDVALFLGVGARFAFIW